MPALWHALKLISITCAPAAQDYRTFECEPCDQAETVVADDPMKSDKAGWLKSELRPPQ
jgi:hypothetical protein